MEKEKIVVLGKTFNSEEERREYFRNDLRKKLPELKKMEGFPIGEDEDIIALSDPPYYTACPNPWLNDFIAQWEEEKKELEKQGKRKPGFEVDEPYAADVSEGKNNPIYNAHTYHTKVPHPAIMRYLLHYTQPGDIVFDGFAGTGMTGVASNACEKPEPEFQLKIKNEFQSKSIYWGKRQAICNDLSPIAAFISYGFNKKKDIREYLEKISTIIDKIELKYSWMYKTIDPDTKKECDINYTVWSDVYSCGNCSIEDSFWNFAVDKEKYRVKTQFKCPHCNSIQNKKTLKREWTTLLNPFNGETYKEVKQVPVQICYISRNKIKYKEPDEKDLDLIERINNIKIEDWYPKDFLPVGDKTMDPINKGVKMIFQFYTKRNLIVLSSLKKHLEETGIPYFNFLFTALDHGMGKRVKHGNWSFPMSILSGTLYLPSLTRENRPFKFYRSKLKKQAHSLINVNLDNTISTGSATDLNINNEKVDYIFVDPPFGKNIMYSELNYMNECWIKVKTNSKEEAIENRSQNKNIFLYQDLMYKSFKEFYRILKPGKWMTIEFSNTSAAIWNTIQNSIQLSGFIISNVAALDKEIGSFNAINSLTAVKQDLVISCYKPSSEFDNKFKQHQHSDIAVWDFVEEHLNHLPIHLVKENATTAIIERSPKILYDRMVAFYVQKGLPVPLDAGKFQQGLRECFIERDGMFFTPGQVQEYDKKKEENPEFVQLSLLVSSEQDGVLWLKNLLQDNPLTYQDIQPQWMQALAGVRKGDVLPELMHILEENFLKDEQGRWYLPDPENQADLEKLRTKHLLRQFDVYKEQAYKPKGKIKEARVEALRAGFKHCYQEKDFQTIVKVAERIPNNLLMEDEVLLQFYDIAVGRV